MAKYIDYHAKLPPMPPEAVTMMQDVMRSGKADEFGVKAVNAFMSSSGQAWCLTEAPSADAVCKSHQAKGITLEVGDVHEVQSVV
ncbi:MAG: hypothetical protein HYY02_05600 [Chloroflexi bacterium]|nr:hypothetical protein [Chloroflexota bacterium]